MLQRRIRLNCDVENIVMSDFDYEVYCLHTFHLI